MKFLRWRPLAAALLLGAPAIALAHNGATGIVGERMMAMSMLSEQIKTLVPAVESGEVTQAQVDAAARMILMHSGESMTRLFPEGSIEAPSEALPSIWQRWDEFSTQASQLKAFATELQQVRLEKPELVSVAVEPQPTEWERMTFSNLLGLEPNPLTRQPPVQRSAATPEGPNLAEVVQGIVRTCSSCHTSFRR